MSSAFSDSFSDATVHRRYWSRHASEYQEEHADYLQDFYWCPERIREEDAQLLGNPGTLQGQTIIELGGGTAPCSAWLAQNYDVQAICLDISLPMLHGVTASVASAPNLHLLQANAQVLPFHNDCADQVFSSFGAFPFLSQLPEALTEVHRVLKPGGRLVIATNHPMAWVFPDDPECTTADIPYFQRSYIEHDEQGHVDYVEYHHTFGDWIQAHHHAGLILENIIEPQWTSGTPRWGQWSSTRGAIFPGTAIFCSYKPHSVTHDIAPGATYNAPHGI